MGKLCKILRLTRGYVRPARALRKACLFCVFLVKRQKPAKFYALRALRKALLLLKGGARF